MPDRSGQAALIMNPAAGDGEQAAELRELVAQRSWLDLLLTSDNQSPFDLARKAAEAGYGTVIAGGGDGTVHHVVNGLWAAQSGARLAVLPLGTANDFSRTMDIPAELEAGIDVVQTGTPRTIDLIEATDGDGPYVLINAATAGFSLLVDQKLNRDVKHLWGAMAYFRAAIDALPELEMADLQIVADDEHIEARSGALMLCNGRYIGGAEIAPTADPGDHRLEMVVVTAETLLERTSLAGAYAVGQQLQSDHTVHRSVSKVLIQSSPNLPLHSDGEDIGCTPIQFEVLPGAIDVMCPAESIDEE